MKIADIQWRILRAPVLVLLFSIGVAGGLIFWTAQWSAETRGQLEHERSLLFAARQRSTQADQEKLLIDRYRDAYEELRRSGTVGPEQRVNWLDALRAANRTARTLGVDYQINQQGPSPVKIDTASYKLVQTSMKLNIKLLQEEDLLAFLRALDAQHPGLYLIQDCKLNRLGNPAFSVRFEPKLAAECDLIWLSLIDPATGEAKKP